MRSATSALRSTRSASASAPTPDRKSTRLNSSHTEIYTLSLHDALPISPWLTLGGDLRFVVLNAIGDIGPSFDALGVGLRANARSEEHTSELQSHRDLHSFPTRRSSDLALAHARRRSALRRAECDRRHRPFVRRARRRPPRQR